MLLFLLACGGPADPAPPTTDDTADTSHTDPPIETGLTETGSADTAEPDSGIEPACVDDGSEDNDNFNEALPMPDGGSEWVVLEDDPDFWLFTVAPGEAKRVTVTFEHDAGNVDLTVYDALYLPVGTGYGFGDTEEVEVSNDSGVPVDARARVLLREPGCNTYNITVTDL